MYNIVFLPGDGIGKEVSDQAKKVLESVGNAYSIDFTVSEGLVGGASIDVNGVPMTENVLEECKKADTVFLGAIGGPKWDNLPLEKKPERALLELRKELGVYANLRPVKAFSKMNDSSPLKNELLKNVDLLIVRELTGGLYFGKPKERKSGENGEYAVDTMSYAAYEVERIADMAFRFARLRGKKIMSVDKANILATSGLWRDVVNEVAKKYTDVSLAHMLVDNCAMQLIMNPGQFDIILTENSFGDILSDEASVLTGSLGMLPSASLGESTGLYEPVHGSAPDITGQNKANPVGAIKSISMMLKYSFDQPEVADAIDRAVETTLNKGYATVDIKTDGDTVVGTSEFGDLVVENILAKKNN